jgi:HAD superfamily hydrolase (TIGR01509 family)
MQDGGNILKIEGPFWAPAKARGFILDWDGVLAETTLDFAPLKVKWFGGRQVLLWEAAEELSPEKREVYREEIRALEMDGAERARPVPGALELLDWIRERGIPWVVLSRNCRDSILRAARVAGIPLPPTICSRDDPGPLKPDPGSVRNAAAVLGVPIRQCLLVGDFLYDVMAARRAACRAVLVRRSLPECRAWADVSYPEVSDLVRDLRDPVPLVPFEWARFGRTPEGMARLRAAWDCALVPEGSLLDPADPRPGLDEAILRAAALGVREIRLPPIAFSPSLARANPALDRALMGDPLPSAVEALLETRFPLVSVRRIDAGPDLSGPASVLPDLKLCPNPDVLESLVAESVGLPVSRGC